MPTREPYPILKLMPPKKNHYRARHELAKRRAVVKKDADRTRRGRWGPLLAETRFTELANGFLDYYADISRNGMTLNSSDAMLLVHIWRFKWDQYDPYPSYMTLANVMGLQVSAIRKIVRKLEKMELIKRTPRREQGADGKDGQWLGNFFSLDGLVKALEERILLEQPDLAPDEPASEGTIQVQF